MLAHLGCAEHAAGDDPLGRLCVEGCRCSIDEVSVHIGCEREEEGCRLGSLLLFEDGTGKGSLGEQLTWSPSKPGILVCLEGQDCMGCTAD